MKKKKGFTLVELLAVIVILAVILVIAVPKIMDTIKNSKEGTLMSSAKLIASQAEKKYVENQVLGINDVISCDDVAKTTGDYDYCNISFDSDGKASVTISGKGKFEGMAVCNATKTEADISDNCYTNEACFAYAPSVSDFDIDSGVCESYMADWGMSTDDITAYCTGGVTSEGNSIANDVADGYASELVEEGVISNVEYDGIQITGYDTGCATDVWIPETINNETVIGIGVNSFNFRYSSGGAAYNSNNNDNSMMLLSSNLRNAWVSPVESSCWSPDFCYEFSLTSIKLPSTIEYIGAYAFNDNYLNGTLDFSNLGNLKNIGAGAFENNEIETVILPSSVTRVGSFAFYDYSYDVINDLDIVFPKNVTVANASAVYDNCAFGYKEDIANHNLPNSYVCNMK